MRTRLLHLWDALTSGYWFLPLLLSVGAIGLAEAFLALDSAIPDERLQSSRLLYVGDLEAIRTTLITVATVTLGTAGVVLSLTTVPFTVAASQFGSRLLRNFLRDTITQVVLSAYFATFLYCVVVLFSLPGDARPRDLPFISVTVSLFLALLSFVLLVFFINNIGVSLQAPVVVAEVSHDLDRATAYFTEDLCVGQSEPQDALTGLWEQAHTGGARIVARRTGYAQALDVERLKAAALTHDALIAVDVLTGQFIAQGDTLAYVLPRESGSIADADREALTLTVHKALYLSVNRVPTEDIEFAVNQLVEIAMRALSPAINDPFTAMLCLDRLGVGLAQVAGKIPGAPHRADPTGQVRVLYRLTSFAHLCDATFHQIRQYGRGNADVLLRMLDTLERVAARAHAPADRAALLRHIQLIADEARGSALPNPRDAARVTERAGALTKALG